MAGLVARVAPGRATLTREVAALATGAAGRCCLKPLVAVACKVPCSVAIEAGTSAMNNGRRCIGVVADTLVWERLWGRHCVTSSTTVVQRRLSQRLYNVVLLQPQYNVVYYNPNTTSFATTPIQRRSATTPIQRRLSQRLYNVVLSQRLYNVVCNNGCTTTTVVQRRDS